MTTRLDKRTSGEDELLANETRLLDEIDRLRDEVGRLQAKLTEERADRSVQSQVHQTLNDIYGSILGDGEDESAGPTASHHIHDGIRHGRLLPDGRFIDGPVVVGGSQAAAEAASSEEPRNETLFALEEGAEEAFNSFFNEPDPQLDKIRRFLLG